MGQRITANQYSKFSLLSLPSLTPSHFTSPHPTDHATPSRPGDTCGPRPLLEALPSASSVCIRTVSYAWTARAIGGTYHTSLRSSARGRNAVDVRPVLSSHGRRCTSGDSRAAIRRLSRLVFLDSTDTYPGRAQLAVTSQLKLEDAIERSVRECIQRVNHPDVAPVKRHPSSSLPFPHSDFCEGVRKPGRPRVVRYIRALITRET